MVFTGFAAAGNGMGVYTDPREQQDVHQSSMTSLVQPGGTFAKPERFSISGDHLTEAA